ncbi:MAG: autotransporter domain-containing protein [Verrucomicrobia bacterium]|nr:autotransporter domain-containing protein [Verrucomicrobiota bacterium]
MNWKNHLTSLICVTSASLMYAVDVPDAATLETEIINANNSAGNTVLDFTSGTGEIDLSDLPIPAGAPAPFLRPLNVTTTFTAVTARTLTINGNGQTLTAGGVNPIRGFFAFCENTVINDLTFSNLTAQGGTAFIAGGGGGGFGGALFINSFTNVTLSNPVFINCSAVGGDGGPAGQGSGGGGGFLGNGGQGINVNNPAVPVPGGGGGLAFNGGDGFNGGGGGGGVGSPGLNAPSNPGNDNDGGDGGSNYAGTNFGVGGGPGVNGTAGGSGGGGGGGGKNNGVGGNGGNGGGGGGGAAGQGDGNFGGNGGAGGTFAGGGGGGLAHDGATPAGNGGAGGFGGGGGGSGTFATSGISGNGGNGGFGGGGGGSGGFTGGVGGTGGFGAGNGGNQNPLGGGGGGGAGFGGAIFIGANSTCTILGSAQFLGNTAFGGVGGGGGATNGTGAGADIFMRGSATLVINNTTDIDIPNPIEGDGVVAGGGLTKLGCAMLTLNGDNTFTGTTQVQAGQLHIEGSILTDINVSNGAILSGNFDTTGNINNSGIVSPGEGGVGLITLDGTFTNQASGAVLVDITSLSGVRDFILPGAGATLNGGTLDIFVNEGNYIAGTQYTVIGGPVAGTFANVIQEGPSANLFDIGVSYNNGVVLTILQNFIFQNRVINPGIPRAVANCIRFADIDPDSDFADLIVQMGLLNSNDLNRALYNMSPVNYGCLDWINARNNNYLADIISEHLWELCCSPRDCCSCCGLNTAIWIDVFGNLMYNTKHYGHMSRFNAEALGGVIGVDYCFNDCFKIGGAFAYTHTWLQWKGGRGHGEIDSYYGAVYSSISWCCFDLDLSFIGGVSDHHLRRKVRIQGPGTISTLETDLCTGTIGVVTTPVFVNISRVAHSNPDGYFLTGHLGIRTCWEWCCTNFEPFALVDYNYFSREGFTEKRAGGVDLHVKEHHQNMLRSEVGLRAYWQWACDCFCWAPYLGVSWVGEFPLDHCKQRANFKDVNCTFTVDCFDSSVQLVSPVAGIKWTTNCGTSFSIGYKGLYNGSTNINQVDVRVEWLF